MARRSDRTTITAVAAHAGVSPSTVSRVMNGYSTVDPGIAARVRSAAAELNYSASPLARSLVLGRTQAVAFLVPDLGNPTFQGILRAVSRGAARDGYHVLIADSAESIQDEQALARQARRRCDAIVLCAPRMPDEELVRLVKELAPVVVINRDSPLIDAPVLTADYRSGIQLLVSHLYELGHRELAYLGGNPDSASHRQRQAGLRDFAETHPELRLRSLDGGVTFENGYQAADRVLASGATGVLAFNDLVAMGLLSALHDRGVQVPGDLSLTGFDDITFSRYTTPPLTTASVPVDELGEEAWTRLHALIRSERPAHNVNCRPRLETRASTGPVASPRV
jgi:LacI family transcriptional regulator